MKILKSNFGLVLFPSVVLAVLGLIIWGLTFLFSRDPFLSDSVVFWVIFGIFALYIGYIWGRQFYWFCFRKGDYENKNKEG